MAYDIGTARGVIEMQYNGRGIEKAKDDLNSLDDTGKKTGANLNKTANTTGKMGLAIVAGLGLAINSAANFEQRMSAVEAVSGATSAEMDQLSQKALDLGAKTSFSAGEAASAIEELAKAGLSVPEIMNGAADATVALAAAGEIALPEAATIASNALNQFGLQAKQLPNVADLIAGAANASAISVSDLGMSMSQAGAVANLAGLSFEDTATAIALMGNAGIKGSDAGTSLKSMLSRLQPTTAKQFDLFQQLGIITADGTNKFYDATGALKSFDKVAGVLQGSLKGMTDKQKQATLQTLFGSDAIRAAAIMADNGAKGFNKMSDAMNKTTAAEVAATRLDNFKGSLEAFMGSLETVGITLGTVFLPALRKIVEAITQALNWFLALSAGTQKAIVAFIAIAAGALLLVAAIMKIVIFIGKFQTALVLLRGTMLATWAAALAPILPIIIAIAALVAVVVLLWNKSEAFKTAVLAVWSAIQTAVAAVASWFTGTFVPAMQAVWNAIVSGVRVAWNLIVTVIRTYISIVKAIVVTGLNAVRAVWSAVWNTFGPVVKAVWNLIAAIIRLAWTVIKGVVLVGISVVRGAVTSGFNAIRSITSSVWAAIRAVIAAAWNSIKGVVMPAVNLIKQVISVAWTAVKTATTTMWNSLKGVVSAAVAGIMTVVNGIKGQVLGALNFAGEMYAKGQAIIQGLIDGIASMIGKVTDIINSITDKVAKYLPGSPVKEGPLKVLNRGHAGKKIVEMVVDGMRSMQPQLQMALDSTMPMPTVAPTVTPTGKIRPRTNKGPSEALLVGSLDLTGGRAYIAGIAEEVFDSYNDDRNRRGGM